MLTLTFRAAREAPACRSRYKRFARFKGGVNKWGMDKPFPLLEVLEHNGLDDALWALRCCSPEAERDRVSRLFACDCAEAVLPIFESHFPNDNRPRETIKTVRKVANEESDKEELAAARDAAWAAWAAAWAAGAAAGAAWDARDAAWAAAWTTQIDLLKKYL